MQLLRDNLTLWTSDMQVRFRRCEEPEAPWVASFSFSMTTGSDRSAATGVGRPFRSRMCLPRLFDFRRAYMT